MNRRSARFARVKVAGLSLLALPLVFAPNPATAWQTAAASPQPASAPDRVELLPVAAQIARSSQRLSQIWPGYWPDDQAFILHIKGLGALLVSPGPKPGGFEPIADAELPNELKGKAFFHKGTLNGAERPFVLGYPIGEGKKAILVNARPGDPQGTTRLLLHEQFHDYQTTAFKGREQQFVDPLAVKDRVAFAASAETERAILIAALSAQDGGQRKQILRDYFAVRRERERTVPPELVKVEQGFERIEGSATYVERAAYGAMTGREGELPSFLIEELRKPLASNSGAFGTTWFRGRGYSTGAALTYLASQYDPQGWRSGIESGAKPDELVEASVRPISAKQAARLAERARKRFGYEARLRELEPSIRAAEKAEIKSIAEFLGLGRYQVVLETGAAGAQARPGFSASNMTLLGPGTTALPTALVFNVAAEAFSLTVRGRPVLLESASRRFTVLLPAATTLDGGAALPLGKHRLEKLRLVHEGYELSVNKPLIVVVEPQRMVIRLGEAGAARNPG